MYGLFPDPILADLSEDALRGLLITESSVVFLIVESSKGITLS